LKGVKSGSPHSVQEGNGYDFPQAKEDCNLLVAWLSKMTVMPGR